MRDYLYLYSNKSNCLVCSGLEFEDIHNTLNLSHLILLSHDFDDAQRDDKSYLDYCDSHELNSLSSNEIYNFGDLIFSDFDTIEKLGELSELGISELLYFKHKHKPLNKVEIPNIGNRLLVAIHDNGWYLRCFFSNIMDKKKVLSFIKESFDVDFQDTILEDKAIWIHAGKLKTMQINANIDAVLNQML